MGLEKAWKYCEERNMPRFIYISKTDEENADYNATFDALRAKYGNKIAPVVVPIWDEDKKIIGIIAVMNKRGTASGRRSRSPRARRTWSPSSTMP